MAPEASVVAGPIGVAGTARVTLGDGLAVLDLRARRLSVGGVPARLGARAFDLLVALLARSHRLVPKHELLDLVWPGLVVEENNLQVQVMALRRLLGAGAIVTVPGRGYRFALAHGPLPLGAGLADGADRAEGAPMPSADGLVGRDALAATAFGLLAPGGPRLLTFTGPGGSGKTRLALHVAARQAGRMADGAYVVLLAAAREPAQAVAAVAMALGLQTGGSGGEADQVRDFLQPRAVLLVLDNLEHLPGVLPWLGALLAACPRLRLLATSRGPLRLGAEHVLPVPPLDLPCSDQPDAMEAAPALQLLARCTTAQGVAWDRSPDGLRTAAAICTRLDGLPLAIELAAARLRVLTPAALLERLATCLPLLTGGAVDAPQRQRTLRATIAWSHDLLDAGTQRLFRRLGCCVGGWSLSTAEAMDGDAPATLARLGHLLDQALIQRADDVDGQPRFSMLETIRAYALERLRNAGDAPLARQRHAACLADLVEPLDRRLRSAGRAPALELLRAERSNLRAALHWCLRDAPDALLAGRLLAALAWWWYFDDAPAEGQAWCSECLALALPMPEPLRARVLLAAARAAVHGGQLAAGLDWATQASQLARQTGDTDTLAQGLLLQAIAVVVHAPGQAAALMAECVGHFAALGQAWDLALATALQGMVLAWHPGTEDAAEAALADARERFLAMDDAWCLATTTRHLARTTARRGHVARSRQFACETLAAAVRAGFSLLEAGARHHLAQLAWAEGDVDAALHWAAGSILTSWQQGHRRNVLLLCRWVAALLWHTGRVGDAITLFAVGGGETDDPVSMAATIMTPADRAHWTAALAELRAKVPAATLAPAWQAGAAAPLEQVLTRTGLLPPQVAPAWHGGGG